MCSAALNVLPMVQMKPDSCLSFRCTTYTVKHTSENVPCFLPHKILDLDVSAHLFGQRKEKTGGKASTNKWITDGHVIMDLVSGDVLS